MEVNTNTVNPGDVCRHVAGGDRLFEVNGVSKYRKDHLECEEIGGFGFMGDCFIGNLVVDLFLTNVKNMKPGIDSV